MVCCIPAVGKAYDYTKAAISLEHLNSFPWPKIVSKFTRPFSLAEGGVWARD